MLSLYASSVGASFSATSWVVPRASGVAAASLGIVIRFLSSDGLVSSVATVVLRRLRLAKKPLAPTVGFRVLLLAMEGDRPDSSSLSSCSLTFGLIIGSTTLRKSNVSEFIDSSSLEPDTSYETTSTAVRSTFGKARGSSWIMELNGVMPAISMALLPAGEVAGVRGGWR